MPTFTRALKKWWLADPMRLGAALSYYALFSLAPLFLMLVVILGFVFKPEIAQVDVLRSLGQGFGPDISRFIQDLMISLSSRKEGTIALILSIVTILIGALGVLTQLQESLNTIWNISRTKTQGLRMFFKKRIRGIIMIVLLSFVYGASIIVSGFVTLVSSLPLLAPYTYITSVLSIINIIVSTLIIITMCVLAYKFIPETYVSWKAAWIGGISSGVLFLLGRALISAYLSVSFVTSSYGAASTAIALLVWVYYLAQIFFFGAALAYVVDEA
jgi:membrane protein